MNFRYLINFYHFLRILEFLDGYMIIKNQDVHNPLIFFYNALTFTIIKANKI